jgi:hypothetical protein
MNPFDGLDDEFAPTADAAYNGFTVKVQRLRQRRRWLAAGVVAVLALVTTTAAVSLRGGDDDRVQTVSDTTTPSTEPTVEGSTTTTGAPEATTTTPPVVVPGTAAPESTTTTVAAPDDARLDDWSAIRIDAPPGYTITTGEALSYEFTVHNEGTWIVRIAGGCPWFGTGGSRVVCPVRIPTTLAPGASATGVARFYARTYQTVPGQAWSENDPWVPSRPNTFYAIGITRSLWSRPPGADTSNARAWVSFNVMTGKTWLDGAAQPNDHTMAAGESAAVTVTLTNNQSTQQWDWGCLEQSELRLLQVAPSGVAALPTTGWEEPDASDDHPFPMPCADVGWRAPGWSDTRTHTVSALTPGEYELVVGWQRIPVAKVHVVGALDVDLFGDTAAP